MSDKPKASNFIRQIIDEDNLSGKWGGRVQTRFPPEPNGYLHVGHAKSICLNFGLAQEYGGLCNLRFDDTNPLTESPEYVESIKRDVQWLGFSWGKNEFKASDYFPAFYEAAERLIQMGKAYVCSLNAEEMRKSRGTLTESGQDSPYRQRSASENLDLFRRMRAGEFADGAQVLRAKIDMQSPNINLRDPVMFRIRRAHHHATQDQWCIYPIYDFAHCISDSIEGITHSICTLEFEDHRPLYDWYLEALGMKPHPQQIEFARLELNYTITSKRKLKELVEEGRVSGWDDPRMPTISGMRRRGYTPASLRDFSERIGVAKSVNAVDMGLLEFCVREDLGAKSRRTLSVLRPIKVILENYPEDKVEEIEAPYHPQDPSLGSRPLPFSRELYIEADDFMENPPKGYFRLAPGTEVRLRYAYIIKCREVVRGTDGSITALRCTYDPETLGKNPSDGRKVKGIIHWVETKRALKAQVKLYDRLFTVSNPTGDKERDYREFLNPKSIEVIDDAMLEPSLATARPDDRFQFERLGYFCVDQGGPANGPMAFNRIVTLRDSWTKE